MSLADDRTDLRVATLALVTFLTGTASYGQPGLIPTVYGLAFAIAAPVLARATARDKPHQDAQLDLKARAKKLLDS